MAKDEVVSGGGEPRVFGNYEIVVDASGSPVMLGEGAFGRTYLARHPVLGKDAAIKVIGEAHLHSEKARQGFLDEARNAAQLEHPNIARVLDSGDAGGVLYYVMDYCGGGDLQQICERHGALPAEWLYEILRQTLEGLNHAHRQGYVHRDIKPSNIMMASLEMPPVFKLIDFGLTKSLMAEEGGAAVSMDSRFKGTLLFASPEQLREEAVDARSDLFALGMTAWFLAAGRAPVEDRMAAIVEDRLSAGDYQGRLPEELPVSLRAFLGRLLRKDRDRRVQSAADALQLLASGAGTQLVLPRDASGWKLPERRAGEGEPVKGAATEIPRDPPPVERLEGGYRTRYGPEVLEELDSDAMMRIGLVAVDPVSGQRVRLIVLLLEEGDDGTELVGLAEKWAMLPGEVSAGVLRVEVFGDAVVLVMSRRGPGLDMLSVLRARGLLRMRDVSGLLESVAAAADAAREAGLEGVDPAPHRIFLEFAARDGRTPADKAVVPEGPLSEWPDFELRLLPWFRVAKGDGPDGEDGGYSTLVAGAGDWQKGMVQAYAALVYRLLSGRVPPAAALLSTVGYVPVNELSEPGNRALADALADRGTFSRCMGLWKSLQAGEPAQMSVAPSVVARTVAPAASPAQGSRSSGEAASGGKRVLATGVSVTHSVSTEIRKGRQVAESKEKKKKVLLMGLAAAALVVFLLLPVAGGVWLWLARGGGDGGEEGFGGAEVAEASGSVAAGGATGSEGGAGEVEAGGVVPEAFVIRGGVEPALFSVSINGSLATDLRPVGVDGMVIPIRSGTVFPVRFVFEAQGYEREEIVLGPGDSFERADRLVMRRSSGVVEVGGGAESGYELLLFSMLRALDDEPDVSRLSTAVQLNVRQRSSLDLPTGVYRVVARAPAFRQVANVEWPEEVVVRRDSRQELKLEPGLAGVWRSEVPAGMALPEGAELVWRIPEGYTEGMLLVRSGGQEREVAILDGMRYRMFEGVAGRVDPLADGGGGFPALNFTARRTEGGAVQVVLEEGEGAFPPVFWEAEQGGGE